MWFAALFPVSLHRHAERAENPRFVRLHGQHIFRRVKARKTKHLREVCSTQCHTQKKRCGKCRGYIRRSMTAQKIGRISDADVIAGCGAGWLYGDLPHAAR
jgi:hypothetical protein